MKFSTKEMTLVGMMGAFTAVVALVFRFYPIAFGTVPFSVLPFVVVLSGGILGARLGAWSMLVYIVMGLVGIPVFATQPFGGLVYVLKPTFGFLLAYAPAAFTVGYILSKKERPGLVIHILAMMAGMGVIYIVGMTYLYLMTNLYLDQALTVGMMLKGMAMFMGLDVIKSVAAAVVAKMVVSRMSGVISTGDSKGVK